MTITATRLRQVDAAEDFLWQELGLRQLRVRHHDAVARLEVEPEDMTQFMKEHTRQRVVTAMKELGYTWVTLDLAGFRSGSMNEALRSRKEER